MYGFGGGSMLYPDRVQAPPVGEPDGDLITHEPRRLIDQLLTASSSEELASIVRPLIWIHNYTLPTIPMMFGAQRRFANVERWNWPAPDDEAWQYTQAPIRMAAEGILEPR
jgi:peptide/nickel transport system substrate-binding protein